MTRTYATKQGVHVSCHGGRHVLFNTHTGRMFVCNSAARMVWDGTIAGETAEAVAGRMQREYGISREQAIEDSAALVRDLVANKLIELRRRPSFDRLGSPVRLFVWAMWQLVRYDLEKALLGFGGVQHRLAREQVQASIASADRGPIGAVVKAVRTASLFYGRPVKCLQRSVVLTRLLRTFGIPAQVVIGYRPTPFFSHAWVEVDGVVINDSRVLPKELVVLHRI